MWPLMATNVLQRSSPVGSVVDRMECGKKDLAVRSPPLPSRVPPPTLFAVVASCKYTGPVRSLLVVRQVFPNAES